MHAPQSSDEPPQTQPRPAPFRLLRSGRVLWGLAASLCLAVFLFATWPLVRGRIAPIYDADGFFVPYYTLVADFARQGRLLLWNPWTSGGAPDYIEPQIGASSPLVVLSALLTGGGLRAYRIHWLGLWFFGALGVLRLGRRWHVPPDGAIAVAVGFAFCGVFTGNAEHLSWVHSFALLPWIVERLDVAVAEGRWDAALIAGAFWGLSMLGGYPAIVFIAALFILAWLVGRARLWSRTDVDLEPVAPSLAGRKGWRLLALLTAAGFVAAIVMLPPLVGMLVDGRGFTMRSAPLERAFAITSNALHPLALTTFASPYLASLPPALLWPYTDISSCSVYIGTVPLFLASFALAARPRSRVRWWTFAVSLLCLGVALGVALPLRGWLYDLVPPTRFFRHPSVFRIFAMLGFIMLALQGARDLLYSEADAALWVQRVRPLGVALVLAPAAVWAFGFVSARAKLATEAQAQRDVLVLWGGVLVIGIVAGFVRGRARRGALGALLVGLAAFDAHESFSLAVTVGQPQTVPGWRELTRNRQRGLDVLATGDGSRLPFVSELNGFGPGPTNKHLFLKRPAFRAYGSLLNPIFDQFARDPLLFAPVIAAERIYFASAPPVIQPSQQAFAEYVALAHGRGRLPFVIHDPAAMLQVGMPDASRMSNQPTSWQSSLKDAPTAEIAHAIWRRYDPNTITLDVSAPKDGWLMVTDRWARGWRATVDGRDAPVYGADFLFRAVHLTAGAHTIEMVYRPFGHPWLVFGSWGTLVLVAVASLVGWRARSRSLAISGAFRTTNVGRPLSS